MSNRLRIGLILLLVLSLSLLTVRNGDSQEPNSIIILSPGNGSFVTSPIPFSAELEPGEDGMVRVTLTAQNGQLLVRQLMCWAPHGESRSQFTTELVFEIPTETAQALITIETQDKYHRPMASRSVLLSLQSTGETDLQPIQEAEPWITISDPKAYQNISGGEFMVKGMVTPVTGKPIIFELIRESGGVIGSKQLAVNNPGEPMTFEIPLSYSFVSSTQDVRLVMRQTVDPYARNIVLDSLPLFLTP